MNLIRDDRIDKVSSLHDASLNRKRPIEPYLQKKWSTTWPKKKQKWQTSPQVQPQSPEPRTAAETAMDD